MKLFLCLLMFIVWILYIRDNICTLHAHSLQLCLILWDTMDCNPQASSVHGILQTRILECVAISFSRGSSWPKDWTLVSCIGRPIKPPGKFNMGVKEREKVKSLSRVRLFATPWTAAHQAPLSVGFSRQEHWSGLPFPSPGDLPDLGIELGSPALQADALPSEWNR